MFYFFTVNIESTIMIYKYIIKNNKNKKTSNYSFYGYLVILINKNMRSKHSVFAVFAVYSACCLKLLNKHTNELIFSITWDNG